MIWELTYDQAVKEALAKVEEKKGVPSEVFDKCPMLTKSELTIWDSFWWLAGMRSMGFEAPDSFRLDDIVTCASLFCIKDVKDYVEIIVHLDAVWLRNWKAAHGG